MIRIPSRPAAALAAVLALSTARVPAPSAAPETLPDSTMVDHWTLANGLRVTTRHVPGATAVSISVGYASGTAADAPGQEGLAWLLAEAQFTAAAGDLPDRTREEIDSQRPLGWHVKVLPRATVFTEAATPAAFPVVLHQAAQRMRGVQVTSAVIERAVQRVRSDLRGLFHGDPDSVAYTLPGVVAEGADEARLQRLAEGAGLSRLSPREVQRLLGQRFVPAGAVVALAGDLSGLDLRAFVEREFGGLPGGRAPLTPERRLRPGAREVTVEGLADPLCAVGVIAPAVTDADHPEFFVCALLMGSRARGQWWPPVPPLSSPFKFALFDDPDLVRFYPPSDPVRTDTTWAGDRLEEALDPMARGVIPDEAVDAVKRGVYWLLGGPMLPAVAHRAAVDPALLYTLSASMATRSLWGSTAFWDDYRRRFAAIRQVPLETWVNYALRRDHQVRVVLRPARPR